MSGYSAAPVDKNSNKPLYRPSTVSVNWSGGSCNSIDDSYARICACAPNEVKNTNLKVFNLISKVNETRF